LVLCTEVFIKHCKEEQSLSIIALKEPIVSYSAVYLPFRLIKMATPNPMDGASAQHPPVSCKTFHIAGIITNVYGLDEIPKGCDSVACLWLLHPRLQKAETMAPIASHMINAWNKRPQKTNSTKGLIAVSFDQRNHGSRQVVPLANEAWKQGNPTHAQDMFGVFQGTSFDTSLLMDHLGSYIFLEPGAPSIKQHLAMGISLGGHSTWHQFFHEPRVSAAVVIIGCPDYQRKWADGGFMPHLC
jgi:hypothetical protein